TRILSHRDRGMEGTACCSFRGDEVCRPDVEFDFDLVFDFDRAAGNCNRLDTEVRLLKFGSAAIALSSPGDLKCHVAADAMQIQLAVNVIPGRAHGLNPR